MVKLNIDLPDSFFLEEEINGYLVSTKTKELWAVQLDLLNELDRVCKKYNLKYFFDFGSLLGAVRHKGFIPWDEDIDVSMLREDYDKLMEIGPKEFKHPYFFQNHRTEDQYDILVTRLRRSDTTFLHPGDVIHRNKKYNLGIFIDIFVYDDVPSCDRNVLQTIHDGCMKYNKAVKALVNYKWVYKNPMMTAIMYLRYAAYKIRYGSARKAFKQMERIAMQFNNKNSDFVSIIFSEQPLRCYPKNWFDDIIYMPFETIIAPVPAAYDVLLKEHYGDYMTPVVDPTPKVWFFDADRPYAECVNDEYFYDDVMRELSIEPVDDEIGVWESLQVLYKKVVKVFKTKP